MATLTKYPFVKSMDIPSLTTLIQASSIATVLDHIESVDDEIDVWFRDALSSEDVTTLNGVVDAYAPIDPPTPPPAQVQTLFEAKDKTLKLVSISADIDENGDCTMDLKVPGTPGVDGRYMSGGYAWFSQRHDDDRIMGVYFVDKDGMLGTPNAVIGSYTEDETDDINKGWRIPPVGHIEAETIGFYGFAPAGFYMRIVGKSGNGAQSGKKLYINIEWGKVE